MGVLLAQCALGQEQVTVSQPLKGQSEVHLDFDFADNIEILIWDTEEVKVEVQVLINGGEDNHHFELQHSATATTAHIWLNMDKWKDDRRKGDCNYEMDLHYKVYLPARVRLMAKTINGSFAVKPLLNEMELKTISGDIDIYVKAGKAVDFRAKTISGEIYSDLDLEYPEGKEGLRQVVGMNVHAKTGSGGAQLELETISGSIYLRRG